MTVRPISRAELQAKLAAGDDVVVVEALGPITTVLPGREALVVRVLLEHSCQNSVVASTRLVELGFTDVHEYGEGTPDWIEASLPLKHTTAA